MAKPKFQPPKSNIVHAVGQQTIKVQASKSTQTQSFSGPIPSPQHLEQYNNIIPDAAERILRMAESETMHRHEQDRIVVAANISNQSAQMALNTYQAKAIFRSDAIGQLLGFAVCLCALGGAVYLASVGQAWVAGFLAALPLAAIVKAFMPRFRPQGKLSQ